MTLSFANYSTIPDRVTFCAVTNVLPRELQEKIWNLSRVPPPYCPPMAPRKPRPYRPPMLDDPVMRSQPFPTRATIGDEGTTLGDDDDDEEDDASS